MNVHRLEDERKPKQPHQIQELLIKCRRIPSSLSPLLTLHHPMQKQGVTAPNPLGKGYFYFAIQIGHQEVEYRTYDMRAYR